MRASTVVALNAADASIDQTSVVIAASQLFYCSAQVVVSGSSTGALKLQFSNDLPNPSVPPAAPTHWVDIPNATSTVTTAGTTGIVKTEICYNWIRAVWTHNNGSAGAVSVNLQVMGN